MNGLVSALERGAARRSKEDPAGREVILWDLQSAVRTSRQFEMKGCRLRGRRIEASIEYFGHAEDLSQLDRQVYALLGSLGHDALAAERELERGAVAYRFVTVTKVRARGVRIHRGVLRVVGAIARRIVADYRTSVRRWGRVLTSLTPDRKRKTGR